MNHLTKFLLFSLMLTFSVPAFGQNVAELVPCSDVMSECAEAKQNAEASCATENSEECREARAAALNFCTLNVQERCQMEGKGQGSKNQPRDDSKGDAVSDKEGYNNK